MASSQHSSEQQTEKPMPVGLGLDLTKAKHIQQELLANNPDTKLIVSEESKTPSEDKPSARGLGLPLSTMQSKRSEEAPQETTGPSLNINIYNVVKVNEINDNEAV